MAGDYFFEVCTKVLVECDIRVMLFRLPKNIGDRTTATARRADNSKRLMVFLLDNHLYPLLNIL